MVFQSSCRIDHGHRQLSSWICPVLQQRNGEHMNWLAERGVQCVSSTMLAQGGNYDNYHLHDHQFNRKLVYRFLRGAITLHLKYAEIMTKRDDLRHYVESFIANEQDRMAAVRPVIKYGDGKSSIHLGKFNHDRSLFSRALESWLIKEIIRKWP
jgi:hypothetical protein